MKQKIDITKIMDDYTDNEFGIEGELAVDEEKAVSELLAQVKPKKTFRTSWFKVLIAAAALVCMSAIVGFTYLTYEWSISGSAFSLTHRGDSTEFQMTFDGEPMDHPVKLEDDRIIFTYEGEETDITDLIDEETPYVYAYTTPAGTAGYIIVGGTVEDFGYANVYDVGNDFGFQSIGVKYNNPDFDHDAWYKPYYKGEMDWDTAFRGEYEQSLRQWFITAWDQLGYDGFNDLRGEMILDDYDEVLEGTYSVSMSH